MAKKSFCSRGNRLALCGMLIGVICILFPAACILLIVFGVVVAKPGLFGKSFQATTCETISTTISSNVTCNCFATGDADVGRRAAPCKSHFPCYVIQVAYDFANRTSVAVVHNTEKDVLDNFACFFRPECSKSYQANVASVETFINSYGFLNNSTFPCLYNPENMNNVILTREFSDVGIITSLAIPAGIITIFFVMICVLRFINCSTQRLNHNTDSANESPA